MLHSDHEPRRPDRLGRVLAGVTGLYVATAAACALGIAIDEREIAGEPAWVKPLKFAVSIGLVGATTSWLRNRLPRTRATNRATIAITVALVVEQVLIGLQAARGVRSHFNVATPFDGAVFGAMGIFVAIAFAGLLVLALQATRRSTGDRVVDAVARWGCWLVMAGASVGFALVAADAHTLGGPDGGPGLPLVGWSTEFGDLRPGHFVGLHGLQALIVLAALAGRARLTERRTLAAIRAVGTVIAVLTVALTIQAFAERSVTSASSIVVIVVAAAAGAWAAARSRGRPADGQPVEAELAVAR